MNVKTLLQGPARRALLLAALALVMRLLLGLASAWMPGPEELMLYYARVAVQELLLWGLPALALRPWRTQSIPRAQKRPGLCLWAVLLGVTAQAALMPVTDWWAEIIGAPLTALALPQGSPQWLMAILALCVIPALCEEAFFRGGVTTGLAESAGMPATLVLCSALFALMHGSLPGLPAHLTVSLLATLMFLRYGRLRLCILFHLGYNAAALFLQGLNLSLGTSAPLGLILAAAALWLAGGAKWYSRRRMALADVLLASAVLAGAAIMYLPELLVL